jgi:hypothetical protein
MTPRQFFRRFRETCGIDAEAIWPLLDARDIGELAKGEGWEGLELFLPWWRSGDAARMGCNPRHACPLPRRLDCAECRHRTARIDAGVRCVLKNKLIPLDVQERGCKDWINR